MNIIDFHTHVFPPQIVAGRDRLLVRDAWFGELYGHERARMATAPQLLRSMDRAGISRSVVFGFPWKDAGLLREGNDYVFDAVAAQPDRLIGFISLHPNETRTTEAELARVDRQPVSGIGELMPDGNGFRLSDLAVMRPVAEFAVAHKLPLLTHTSEPVGHEYPGKGRTYARSVLALAESFPELVLVCGHWGGGLIFYELILEVSHVLRNVYYDTAASCYIYDERIFRATAHIAPQKVLFATDYPMATPKRMMRHLDAAKLTEAQRQAILSGNAQRLLRLKA